MADFNYPAIPIGCCSCAGIFAVLEHKQRQWKDEGSKFWCPYCGTPQSYGKSRVSELESELRRKSEHIARSYQSIHKLERSLATYKGQITKLKRKYEEPSQ